MKLCPTHKVQMTRKHTRFGWRYDCPVNGCDVMCWGGETSTPADQRTRDARNEAHLAFDSLWKGKATIMSRAEAYKWLAETMQ
jgi:hypothetical protein